MSNNKTPIIISLGGSLIVPDEIDIEFLLTFKQFITNNCEQGNRFIIICGGGKTARNYQNASKYIHEVTAGDLDWLGIYSTHLNAHLMRIVLSKFAHPSIWTKPSDAKNFTEHVLVAGGWKPGMSTDADALILAKKYGVKNLINLSNVDFIYNKDPNKFDDAVPLKEISWKDYRKLIPKDWDPGLHTPFDPVASRMAQKVGLEVAIISVKNLDNVQHYIDGKGCGGTRIHP
ncbi:UMP kinase [Candidatus Uhrbacteria bacterium]|nr:UMP kinase [Candidatus Uhrbacteria bacterium]